METQISKAFEDAGVVRYYKSHSHQRNVTNENIEIETRFGNLTNKGFVSDVGTKAWSTVHSILKNTFGKPVTTESHVYQRTCYRLNMPQKTVQRKETVLRKDIHCPVENFEGKSLYDIRLAVAVETDLKEDRLADIDDWLTRPCRVKKRHTFTYRSKGSVFKYDLTEVKSINTSYDRRISYEIEIELVETNNIDYAIAKLGCLTHDVWRMITNT